PLELVVSDLDDRRLEVTLGSVEPNDPVEVDNTTLLEFGHLGVRHADGIFELAGRHAELVGKATPQRDDKPAPKLGSVPVEQHRSDVVVTVQAQRLTKFGIAVAMAAHAPRGPTVLTQPAF